jgi:hypothetical protein
MTVYEPDEPPAGVPVEAGDVFLVPPVLYNLRDPKKWRPIVATLVEPSPNGHVHLVARTSNTDAEGLFHPRDRELGLDRDGVWEPMPHSIWRPLLGEPTVERLGKLMEPYWSRVLKMWEEGEW